MGLFSKKKVSNMEFEKKPKHIAIMMDGNGRWAKKRGLPRSFGHKAGMEPIREIVKECSLLDIGYLTLYAFSTENWKRPEDEVKGLMKLLTQYLRSEFNELNENNVIINYIGDISQLPIECQEELEKAKKLTQSNTGLTLNLALNYGGRNELLHSVKTIAEELLSGKLTVDEIDEQLISSNLYTQSMPDPDLMIRTSGEMRLSNFLIWQLAYAEFYFPEKLWPDFTRDDLHEAIRVYASRDRRFGAVK